MNGRDIQQEIDWAGAKGGGTVTVPAGVCVLHDALHLRSGVTLLGEPGATLLKAPSRSTRILDYLAYGLQELRVADPDGLEIGMGVVVTDDHAGGFYDTVATIVGRQDDTFFIDRAFHHDYLPPANARVSTLFPLVSAVAVQDASVQGLILDGNPDETRELNGCRGGGIFALQSRNIHIRDCEVRSYRGDAISFQQCLDIRVEGCHLHHNSGHGLHPGCGSVRYWLTNNRLDSNGRDGIFYCVRTTHSLCRGNEIRSSGGWGISLGERDTDHRIEQNTITDGGAGGIVFRRTVSRGADRVELVGNTLGPNGEREIWVRSGVNDITIARNHFQPGAGAAALEIESGCERIFCCDNQVSGRPMAPEDLVGDRAAVQWSGGLERPVGPEAVGSESARHLGVQIA